MTRTFYRKVIGFILFLCGASLSAIGMVYGAFSPTVQVAGIGMLMIGLIAAIMSDDVR